MLKVKQWLNIRKYASDEIVAKWRDTGLLDGVDLETKRILAKLFEDVSNMIQLNNFGDNTKQVLYPIARVSYCKFGHYIRNIHDFCDYVDININTRCNRVEGIKAYEINTSKKYSQEEKINKALSRRPDVPLPADYLGIDIQAELVYLIAREVAEKKI